MEEQPKKSLPAEDPSSLQIRIRTIRGLPLLFTKEPTDIVKMIDILFAHICSESVREAVYEVLTLCMNCELEASMKALFRHIGEEPKKGEEVINFVVLWTRSSGQMKEVLRIIEAHARSDAFEVSDADCINRLISCVRMTLPFVVMSASSSRFIGFINRKILPVFDQPLHAVAPIFIGDTSISLSWAPPSAAAAGAKRAADGSIKKGRGSMPNLLFKRAIDGLK